MGQPKFFQDILGPLVSDDDIRGKNVADISGSGTGRIVNMLFSMGAEHVTAIEPSAAFEVLKQNVAHHGDKFTCLQLRGDQIPPNDFDHIFSLGVLIIIPDPKPVVEAAFRALKPEWTPDGMVYGREGVELYLSIFEPLMKVTRKLPHPVLSALCWGLTVPLSGYIAASRVLPLPMQD